MADQPFRVLFVSDDNACRSPMAEALLCDLCTDDIDVTSAGLMAGSLSAQAVEVLEEVGITITHQPRALAELGKQTFDLVITLSEPARELHANPRALSSTPGHSGDPAMIPLCAGVPFHLHWDIASPTSDAGDADPLVDACRATRDTLRERVSSLLEQGWLQSVQDERRRQRALLDAMQDGVLIHDDLQIIYQFNQAAEQMTGFRREDVLGRHCHELFAPTGFCRGQCDFACGIPSSFEGRKRDVPLVTHSGESRVMRMSVTRTVGERDAGHVVASFRDVTELLTLRQDVRRTRSLHGMVAASAAMQEVFETIRQVASTEYPTLILGESGTGKELVANAIHLESPRAGGPFVPINCGALPENILESELFGHVRGAFTGAIRDKKGRFELAKGGTLFLDEVGELSPAFQVRLLRVLQEKRFEKVGGEKTVEADVRILAATNRDLRRMAREGEFREDLFYRLCVIPITLPPLRDRREDIPQILERVLEQIRKESGKEISSVSHDAMQALMTHNWPGNVRELINVLQYASVRCSEREIDAVHLPTDLMPADAAPGQAMTAPAFVPTPVDAPRRRLKLTVESVRDAIAQAGGNKVKAAKLLGVGRATLYRFLDRHPVS